MRWPPSPYLLTAIRERRKTARERAVHYRQYESASAKADEASALADVEFYTAILELIDPKERRP